jgi:N-acetylglucosaminyl-diphospho-decaprenol L-rhamnosyltransferase
MSECFLSIIIVNYKTHDLLLNCLRSVMETVGDLRVEVWVVDNASGDDSVAAVRAAFPAVHVIANEANLGFARANNQALMQASGSILVLLNPDTRLMPGVFAALQQAFDQDKKVGVVGAQLLNADGSIQPSCGRFASVWTEFFFQFFVYKILPSPFPLGDQIHPLQRGLYGRSRLVGWVTGACLAVRREVVAQVGLLDEAFFMYGEDMEWCWRAKRAGFIVCYQPAAQVVHYARQSSRRDYRAWINRYTRGQLRFIRQTRGAFEARLSGLWICLGSLLRIGLWSVAALLRPARRGEARQRLSGYRDAITLGYKAFQDKLT